MRPWASQVSRADVLTPTTLHADAPSGRRFANIDRVEIDNLATIGRTLGRRGDVVKTMWEQTAAAQTEEKQETVVSAIPTREVKSITAVS